MQEVRLRPCQGDGRETLAPRQRLREKLLEYHPRKWVDCSRPAYKRRRLDRFFESHPREWVVFLEFSRRVSRGGYARKPDTRTAPRLRRASADGRMKTHLQS